MVYTKRVLNSQPFMKSNVAVVILNWNGHALLQQFLPSVVQYSAGANVYVADNASTDDSIELLKTKFPSVKIIQNARNGGYAGGYNDALKELKEDYFVLLNKLDCPNSETHGCE